MFYDQAIKLTKLSPIPMQRCQVNVAMISSYSNVSTSPEGWKQLLWSLAAFIHPLTHYSNEEILAIQGITYSGVKKLRSPRKIISKFLTSDYRIPSEFPFLGTRSNQAPKKSKCSPHSHQNQCYFGCSGWLLDGFFMRLMSINQSHHRLNSWFRSVITVLWSWSNPLSYQSLIERNRSCVFFSRWCSGECVFSSYDGYGIPEHWTFVLREQSTQR